MKFKSIILMRATPVVKSKEDLRAMRLFKSTKVLRAVDCVKSRKVLRTGRERARPAFYIFNGEELLWQRNL
jgi:transketolase C-terminal domain/subunit